MSGLGLTKACTMGPIAQAIEAAGGSVSRVFRRAEVPLSLMDDPERLMLLRDQLRLVEGAVREIGDPALLARLAIRAGIDGLGAISRHVRSTETLGDAIARVGTVTPAVLQTATWTGLRFRGDRAVYGYAVTERIEAGRQTNEILALGYLLSIMRHFLGQDWRPERAIVTGAVLPDRSEIESVFGCDITLGPNAGLVFRAELLDTGNPAPCDLLAGEEPAAPLAENLTDIVGHLVRLSLCEGRPSIDWVSRRLGLSRRTLQRRLEGEGTSFAMIQRGILMSEAKRLLAACDRPIGRIALELGYADAAHFSRAFLDWTGVTPRYWRQTSLRAHKDGFGISGIRAQQAIDAGTSDPEMPPGFRKGDASGARTFARSIEGGRPF
ncbi:transcriptional regulator, AraC family [Methylobacterium nodulans ORS 2060]|uniref:Transcriptional regulator, AraC family n=2 Tax=Methylobacterium nodulans TaxID=114616 RepID=B8IE97_METNO|nr:transcriptional regulator, AraC family [Methylobacterium nodulans ORS 2060]